MLRLKSSTGKVLITIILCISVLCNTNVQLLYAESVEVGCTTSIPRLSFYKMYNEYSKKTKGSYIYYGLNGGVNSRYNPEYIQSSINYLYSPHKYGYNFMGWYLDPDFEQKVYSVDVKPGKGIALYARWSRKINNEFNVENYEYLSAKSGMKDVILLKDCDYSFCEDVDIPGMPMTKEDDFFNKYIFSEAQCPQGLCFTEDFILVTSYSDESGCLGELMVFDKKSGNYLITLGMDPESHLGGIAYDGENVWVCNSKKLTIERISYDFIKLLAEENPGEVIDATSVVDAYDVANTPSCITFYGGRLWIASYNDVFESKIKAYNYNVKEDRLEALSEYNIPARVQGVAFDDDGEVYLSTSLGRKNSSYLKIYDSIVEMSSRPNEPQKTVELLPGSEEIDILDNSLYVVFESAGQRYLEGTDGKGVSSSPIDKILQVDIESIK